MNLFSKKNHNSTEEDEPAIRDSDLCVIPEKERRPAKIYSLLFIILLTAGIIVLIAFDREPVEEPDEAPVLISVVEESQEMIDEKLPEDVQPEPVSEPVIPDYNQQPGQAKVEYRKYEINSIVYEIRNDAAFVVGTVGNKKNVKYLTIESSVKYMYPVVEICEGAFSGCRRLLKVHIPDSVIIIRESAFENCKKLERVRMSEGLITIEGRAFAGCTALKSLRFPATVKELRADVFEGDTKLTKLRIPESCRIPEGNDPFGLGGKLKIEIY